MGRPLQGAQSGRFCFRALGTGALQTGGDTSSEIVPLALPPVRCYIVAVAQTLEVLTHLGRPGLSPETGLFAYLAPKNTDGQIDHFWRVACLHRFWLCKWTAKSPCRDWTVTGALRKLPSRWRGEGGWSAAFPVRKAETTYSRFLIPTSPASFKIRPFSTSLPRARFVAGVIHPSGCRVQGSR